MLAERLRIARELHDIVAHSVTIIVLHAAGAKRVVDSDPERAKESLTTIEESGKQAMAELRRLLELLHENEDELDPIRVPATRPGATRPGRSTRSAHPGWRRRCEVTGEPRRLDASIDLAAYRLVQEGLTNVTKHRGPVPGRRCPLDWGAEKVTVAVEDDGAGGPAAGSDVDRQRARRVAGTGGHRRRRLRRRADRHRWIPGRRPASAVRVVGAGGVAMPR